MELPETYLPADDFDRLIFELATAPRISPLSGEIDLSAIAMLLGERLNVWHEAIRDEAA